MAAEPPDATFTPEVLQTQRLIMRPLMPEDELLYCGLHTDPQVMRYVGKPLSLMIAQRSFVLACEQSADPGDAYRVWSIRTREPVTDVGLIGVRQVERQHKLRVGEIGALLRLDVQRMGFAREAAEALITHIFRHTDYEYLVAQHDPAHQRALNGALKLRFDAASESTSDGLRQWQIARNQWLDRHGTL